MQLQNGQRDQEKVTENGKFGPHALHISGHSPRRDVWCLLALAGRYKPLTRFPFLGLPSVITQHCETTEQGSSLASRGACHSFTKAHRRVGKVKQKMCMLRKQSLELWGFLCCPEDPGRSPRMIAYSEQCRIHDLWRRRYSFGTRGQPWSLKSFCVAKFY